MLLLLKSGKVSADVIIFPMASPGTPSVRDLIAAQSMRRLLEAYRSLAPLTIGGPASTSLENSPGQLNSLRPQADPMALRKYARYPWLLGPTFPQLVNAVPPSSPGGKEDIGRRRHASVDSLLSSGRKEETRQSSPSAPLMTTKDRESSSLIETSLEGKIISCFSVGGELRLCLTQILQLVLDSVSLGRIHQACDELQIFCSTCSPHQLAALKASRVLPLSAHQCGLITKSDAERLCSLLLNRSIPPPPALSTSPPSSPPVSPPRSDTAQFKVEHKCFGHCVGILHPQSFTAPTARCIECSECSTVLSPQRFVCHAHNWTERQTCHWGFDSQNWAAYLQVHSEYPDNEKEILMKELENIKRRFSHTKLKRKWIESEREDSKRTRPDDKRGHFGGEEPLGRPQEDQPNIDVRRALVAAAANNSGFDKMGVPLVDPRSLYLPWAGSGLQMGSVVPPFVFPSPYLHSLAQFHNLKALAAKSILDASENQHKNQQEIISSSAVATIIEEETSESPIISNNNNNTIFNNINNNEEDDEEFVRVVQDCLAGSVVSSSTKSEVITVVTRLVNRLNRARGEQTSAVRKIKGMEDQVVRLEQELDKKRGEIKEMMKTESENKDNDIQSWELKTELENKDNSGSYESSSDGGIESGPDVDDNLSEK